MGDISKDLHEEEISSTPRESGSDLRHRSLHGNIPVVVLRMKKKLS